MKIALGADHRGTDVLRQLSALLAQKEQLHPYTCSRCAGDAIDYTDMAVPVCVAVANGHADRGILICATGLGSSITANKIRGIRAALVHDELGAEMARRCLDANVLCLAADLVGPRVMERIVDTFLSAEFEGGRHRRRLQKLQRVEAGDLDGYSAEAAASGSGSNSDSNSDSPRPHPVPSASTAP